MEDEELVRRIGQLNTLAPDIADDVNVSLQIVDDVLRLYSPERIALSFNGGKDATVVFHLTRVVFAQRYHGRNDAPRIRAVFFEESDPSEQFPQVLQFVQRWERRHCRWVELARVSGGIFRGLQRYLSECQPQVQCFFMGTRRTDPGGCEQEHLSPSSAAWPAFLRVNPILHWSYRTVWRFLKVCELDYCAMYDEGYTSIGRVSDTQRNPLLARAAEGKEDNGDGGVAYADFTHLQRDADERCGRVNRASAVPPIPSEVHGRAKARPHRAVSLLISSASVWSALATRMPAAHLLRAFSHIASVDRYVERTVIVGDAAEDIAWEVEHWGRRVSTHETSAAGDEDEVVLVLAHEACGDDTHLVHGVLTGVYRRVCRASACGADARPDHRGRSVTWVVLPSRLAPIQDALRQWDRMQQPPREKTSGGSESVPLERQRWTCCAVADGRAGEELPEKHRPDAPPSALSLPATLTLGALLQIRAGGRHALEIVGDPTATSALYAALSVCMRCIHRADIPLDGYGVQ